MVFKKGNLQKSSTNAVLDDIWSEKSIYERIYMIGGVRMRMKDYYKILGVPEDATMEEIKDAYKRLIKQWHPDRFSREKKREAEERFKEIQEAYEVLSNPDLRAEYDVLRRMKESEYVNFSGNEYSEEGAEEVLRNEEKIKSKVNGWGWSKDILHKLSLLFGIVKDTLSGEFKVSPIVIAAIIAVLVYILSPIDAIPDFIPIAGQADDFTALTMLLASIANVIDQYVEFLKNKKS